MTLTGRSLAGSNDTPRTNDFFPTPAWATHALMKREEFKGNIWEPASGTGDMSKVLEQYCDNVRSSELDTGENVYGEKGVDFLKADTCLGIAADNIITNPPFKLAKEFINQARDCTNSSLYGRKVAMFLKIQFLEGIGRYDFFQDTDYPLSKVWVFSKRVTLYKDGERKGRATGTMCFAWFIWDEGHEGPPQIGWINDTGKNFNE